MAKGKRKDGKMEIKGALYFMTSRMRFKNSCIFIG
jgi:hypothetical protein